MLKQDDTVLVLIDIQQSLFNVMHEKEKLLDGAVRLVRGAIALGVPVVWLEQRPDKIGPTVEPLRELLAGQEPIEKVCFSCWLSDDFVAAIRTTGRRQVLVAGIETHICVYQTASDLVANGFEVQVVSDAVSSRTQANRRAGIDRIRGNGGTVTSVETALFEIMRTADHPAFLDILTLVK